MALDPAATVLAAGGVIVRDAREVVVVHRPKYDDWSLPKGKLGAAESFEEAALREVSEETGLRCEVVRELPAVDYRDGKGRRKHVRYWLMRSVAGDIAERPADREIDEVRWVGADEARRLLTYPRDRDLVAAALAVLPGRRQRRPRGRTAT